MQGQAIDVERKDESSMDQTAKLRLGTGAISIN